MGLLTLFCFQAQCEDRSIREFFGFKLGSFASDEEIERRTKSFKLEKPFLKFESGCLRYANNRRLYAVELSTKWMSVVPFKDVEIKREIEESLVAKYRGQLEMKRDSAGTKYLSFRSPDETPQRIRVSSDYSNGLTIFRADLRDDRIYSGKCPPWMDANEIDPCLAEKTTPITNLFGVTIGIPIDAVSLNHKKLKKRIFDCDYVFEPRKQFRKFNRYLLRVKDGKVAGILATWKLPYEGKGVPDEKAAIRRVLKEKYKFQFVSLDKITHVGNGDDYTYLTVDSRLPTSSSVGYYLIIELREDIERRVREKFKKERENRDSVRSEPPRQVNLEGIDAL